MFIKDRYRSATFRVLGLFFLRTARHKHIFWQTVNTTLDWLPTWDVCNLLIPLPLDNVMKVWPTWPNFQQLLAAAWPLSLKTFPVTGPTSSSSSSTEPLSSVQCWLSPSRSEPDLFVCVLSLLATQFSAERSCLSVDVRATVSRRGQTNSPHGVDS